MTRMASVRAATVAMRSSGQMIVAVRMVRDAFAEETTISKRRLTNDRRRNNNACVNDQ